MSVIAPTDVVWVIVDPAGEVVLICSGAGAPEVVQEWKSKGYRAVAMDADALRAA